MQTQLIQLPQSITCIDSEYMGNGVASIYLLEQDQKVCIIETGTAHSIPHVLSALKELGRTPEEVEYIIPTHIHLDHAGGAGGLMQLCPNASLVVHPRGAYHMAHPEKLQAGTVAVYGEEKFEQLYGSLVPIPEERIIEADDDYRIDFNGRSLTFIDTPGHALHHFCIVDKRSRGIFTGDTFGLSYRQFDNDSQQFLFATTTPIHFDPDALLHSIDKLMSFNPEVMYLTHFCAVKPTAANVSQLKTSIRAFAEIALDAKEKCNKYNFDIDSDNEKKEDSRVKIIERNLLSWIVKQSYKINTKLTDKQRRQIVLNDAKLNAQGLDVWLKRIEKEEM